MQSQASKKNVKNNKKNNKKRQTTVSKSTTAGEPTRAPVVAVLSQCATQYAASLANPFTTPPSCIPSFPALPSRKMKVFARGSMLTSTITGIGFIAFNPGFAIANDKPFVLDSSASYTGATIAPSGTAGVNDRFSNSDYNAAAFGSGNDKAQFRVVSAGLKIRYNGTALYKNGEIILVQDPTHADLTGQGANLASWQQARVLPLDRPIEGRVVWTPAYHSEIDYSYTWSNFVPCIAVVAHCAPASGSTPNSSFYWEAWVNLEVQGRNVVGQSPSQADAVGMSAVLDSAEEILVAPQTGPIENTIQSMLKGVGTALNENLSHMAYSAGYSIANAATAAAMAAGTPAPAKGLALRM